MRKIHFFLIIAVATILALAIQVLFGNFLSARLATLPWVRNFDLFNPRAPIVVTNKETVRVSDANDAVETANSVKSKLAVIAYYEGSGDSARLIQSGGALNWTADGYFITTAGALSVANKTYAVIVSSGDIFPIKAVYADTASNLVIVSTDARNQSTIESVSGNDLRPGQKILMLVNSVSSNRNLFLESFIHSYAADVAGQTFSSDLIQQKISIQEVPGLVPGQAAVNLDGRMAGLWDGSSVISAEAIQAFANNFFQDNLQVIRPSFGFNYRHLSASEARALQLLPGAQVLTVSPVSPAATAGLQAGDVITAANGKKIDDSTLLAPILYSATPGEEVTMTVSRAGQLTTILITPKLLEKE